MNSKYKDLSKNILLFTISNFGSKIIAFLMVPLYTYVLTTSQYGEIDLISTTVQLIIPVLTVNIQDAVLRFALDKRHNPDDVLEVALRILFLGSIILGILLIGIYYSKFFNLGINYFLFLYVSFVFGALNNILTMYLKANDEVRILAIFGITQTIITCLANILFLVVWKMGVNGYFIANTIGIFINDVGLICFGKIDKFSLKNRHKILLKAMVIYSAPLILNSIAWWINNASDRYILTFFCGAAANGIYAVAYKIPTILTTVQSIFYNAWSISAIKEFDSQDKDGFLGNVYTLYSGMSILSCATILLMNRWLASILYSKEFFQAWMYTPALLVGTVFNGLALFNGCFYTVVKRTKEISVTTVLGAGVNIVLNFILIPYIGALGAAFATMIGYGITWLIRTIRMRRIVTLQVNWKIQTICILLLIGQAILCLFPKLIIGQLVVFAFLLIFEWNSLKKLISYLLSYFKKILRK